ncbi:MAG: hypothetical protein ABI867_25305 [Kofleriaceae bacterium]
MKLLAVLVVVLVGCGGTAKPAEAPISNAPPAGTVEAPPPPPPKPKSPAEEALALYEQWTNEMCACPAGDLACAKKITDAQIKWGEEQARNADRTARIDPKEAEMMAAKLKPIMDRFTKCVMVAMTPPPGQGTP